MTISQKDPKAGGLKKLIDPELLIFVRHGQTDWNAQGRMQGHRDIPLNSVGRAQAGDNGKRLAVFCQHEKLAPAELEFVSSPLGRTRATMELLRGELGLATGGYGLNDDLKEITFGAWEGMTLEELSDTEQEQILKRRTDKWNFGYPDGESYAQLAHRVARWLQSVDRPTVVVSHGGVFRVLRGWLEGLPTRDVPSIAVPQDKVFVWRKGRFEEI